MKIKSALLAFLVSSSGFATAASIDLSNIEVEVSSPNGTPVAATVSVGWIDLSAPGLDLGLASSISSNFNSIGSFTAIYASTYFGLWAGETENNIVFDNSDGVAGKNVFYFITDGGSFGLVEDTGVQFKDDNDIINSNTATWTSSRFQSSTLVVHAGTYDQGGGLETADAFNLVPEPSVAILSSLGALFLLRRRR